MRDSDALVELGRVDDGQHLALMNLGPDVLAPFLDVAAHLPMNGGAVKGFDIAGQNEFAGFASLLRRDQRDRGDRLLVGPSSEPLFVMPPSDDSSGGDGDGRPR